MRYFLSFIAIAIGAVMVMKSEWLLEQFGRVDWAEQHLSSDGGSRLFYKLVGLGMIIVALLYMSGIVQDLIVAVFVPATRR